MSDNLFSDLQVFRATEIPVVLQSGTRYPNPRYNPEAPGSQAFLTMPAIGSAPIQFLIHAITANETNDAEALITAMPQPIFQEQPSPTGRGTVQTKTGYDYEDPSYLAAKNKQIPLREAAVCLFGCNALYCSTPGNSLADKAAELVSKIPGAILEWLAAEIGTLTMCAAVGNEEVTSFLARGSGTGDTGNSNVSNTPKRKAAKKTSSKGSTPPTSPTSKEKPPGTGT